MSNKTSVNNSSNKHQYVLDANKESETAIEWATSTIVRTPQGMKNGKYPPDRVQIFIGDLCTWDSDFPTFTFGNDGHIFNLPEVKDVTDYRNGTAKGSFSTRY